MGVLVFDADDTLWQNNVHYNRVVDDFLAWMAFPTLDEGAVRAIMRDIETANVHAHGYGSTVFLRTLHDLFERLHDRVLTEAEVREVRALAVAVVEHQVELIPHVHDTLTELARRHPLALLTKGTVDEQQRKIDASGLAGLFASIHIVADKTPDTYLGLAQELALDPAQTWMIGNSPKSDIISARRAGWNAVFIPNEHTWVHEDESLDPDDAAILRLTRFADLTRHF
jgi:putative hydrolase of the HAD superfamily